MLARMLEPQPVAEGVVRLGSSLLNWYLVEDGGRVTVFDAAVLGYWDQLEPGLRTLGRMPADVEAVVLTHAHADHVGVAERARTELGARVLVHEHDRELAVTAKATGRNDGSMLSYLRYAACWRLLGHLTVRRGMPVPKIAEVETFANGAVLDVPGAPRVVHTPGHTAGHTAFELPGRGALVVGDALCTYNPLTGSSGPQVMPAAFTLDADEQLASLARLEALEADVLLPGHGEPWRDGTRAAVERARARGKT